MSQALPNVFRIKRRAAADGASAPGTLLNAEMAFNEASQTLYIGLGTSGVGDQAASVIAIAGRGAVVDLISDQQIDGKKTYLESPEGPTPEAGDNSFKMATTQYVDRAITAASVPDGDRGDINISGSGSVWTVRPGSISNSKLASVASGTLKGRATAGTGAVEDLTAAQVLTLLGTDNLYQGKSDLLLQISELDPTANQGIFFGAGGAPQTYSLTAGGRALGGVAGTANTLPYFSAANVASLTSFTTLGRTIVGAADGSAVRSAIGAGVGTVTSVAVSVPTGFSVSGPVVSSGTINITYAAGYTGFTQDQADIIDNLDATYVEQAALGVQVATLDANGKLTGSQVPAIAINDVFTVDSVEDMLDLTAERGDMAIRTDTQRTWVLRTEPANLLENWVELPIPASGVQSVQASGGSTGLTFTGGPITNVGTFTLAGTLAISHGGTGATSQSGARTALGLGSVATQAANNINITGGSISNVELSGTVLDGGTY